MNLLRSGIPMIPLLALIFVSTASAGEGDVVADFAQKVVQ